MKIVNSFLYKQVWITHFWDWRLFYDPE